MAQNSSAPTYFTKRNVALSAISLGLGIGYYHHIGSDSIASYDKVPSSNKAHVVLTATEASNNLGDSNESETGASPIAHTHSATCNHGAHDKSIVDRPAPITFTEEIIKALLDTNKGQSISFALPGGEVATGVVEMTRQENGETVMVQGELSAPQKGRFFFQKQSMAGAAGSMVGVVTLDKGDLAYSVEPSADGTPELHEKHADDVYCRNYAMPIPDQIAEADVQPEAIPEDHPTDIDIPDYQNGVIPLSSLPDATAVIYLDFDGEEGPIDLWGSSLDAASFNLSSAQIKDMWIRVAEDFAPLNINVTTDLQKYLDAPENSRQRCLITPTTAIHPGVGGVAFGSFGWTGDVACLCFYSGSAGALVISHEVGHTMGLGHDGINASGYHGGHGSGALSWGPIMGAPYGSSVVQWSKGDYTGATNTQDDLVVLAAKNNVGLRADDHGETLATATLLEVNGSSVDNEGIIELDSDFDSFKFTLTDTSSVLFNVNAGPTSGNLNILAEIVDSTGTVLASDDSTSSLNASLFETLIAGDYFLRVTGVGYGDQNATGFSSYGSLGHFTISGTVPNAVQPDRFSIAENSANGSAVGTVSPRNAHVDPIVYSITTGNSSGAFAIDSSTGALTVADSAQFDYEALSNNYDDPATFELFVGINNATIPSLDETVRVVVTVSDINEAPVITVNSSLSLLEHTAAGTILESPSKVDSDRYDVHTWSITSGNSAGVFAIDSASGVLTLTSAVTAATPSYTLELTVTDTGTPALSDSVNVTVNVIDIVEGYVPGSITQSFYESISGNPLTNLTSSSRFPNDPDSLTEINSISMVSHGDNYGSVIRGYLIPPTTGSYTFWVAGDDQADMRLSTDADPANAAVIATLAGAVGENNWTAQSNQESAPVTLTAGQPYYLEIRHKEGSGGDHISAAWQGPGITQSVIPGSFLAPYELNYTPRIVSSTVTLQDDIYTGHSVTTPSLTDLNNSDTHSGFTITSGNADGYFAIDSSSGLITIVDNSNITAGNSYTLGIEVSDSGTPALVASGSITVNVASEDSLVFGQIQQQIFSNISGTSITNLTGDSNYPDSPSYTRTLTSFDSGQNTAENYGSRIRAYIVPPTTGNYTFYFSSDDNGQLFLSTDDTAGNKTQIASVSGATSYNTWTNSSSAIALTAGQKYYIETLHKEGSGGDHLQVAWEGPDFASPTVIAGTYLERVNLDSAPVWDAAPYAFSADNTNPNGTAVGTVSATDSSSDTLVYAIISGNNNGGVTINPITGVISIADNLVLPLGDTTLTIGVQDNATVYNETLTTVTITVTGSNTPVVNAASFNLVENSVAATPVGTVSFVDPDADTWVHTFMSGNESGHFSIDPVSGAITTSASAAIDFEELNTYSLVVRVTDSSNFYGEATVTVNVTDVVSDDSDSDGLDDAWELAHFGNTSSQSGSGDADGDGLSNLAEQTAGTSASIGDSDLDGFSDSFEIAQGTDPLDINSVPTTLLAAFWDFDDNSTANAFDRIGAVSGVLTSGAAYTSDQGGRSGLAGDRAMDFGTGNTEVVDVTDVTFLNDSAADDILTISFWQKLDSVKDSSSFYAFSPTGSSNNRGIQTHCPWSNNSIYLDMGGSDTGQRSVASAPAVTWTNWNHISLVKNGSTSQIWVNGSLLQTETAMNALNVDMNRLLIGGSDESNRSINGVIDDFAIFDTALTPGQIAQLTSGSSPTTISANQVPVANDATFSVVENSPNSTAVGTVIVTDPGDTITYTITAGNTGNAFAIDNAGNITVDQVVDFELFPSNAYTLTVTVTDLIGDTDTAIVTVNVSDSNDAPTLADASFSLAENVSIGTALTTVVASDPDSGNTFSYAILSGNDDGVFDIDANGEITTLSNLDFNTTQQYQLVIEVTDQGSLTGTGTITVNVTNVVEGTNLALGSNLAQDAGAVATQSSTAHSGSASLAIDENTDGSFANGSVTHTDSAAVGAVWWQVDLGQDSSMHTVKLFNRAAIQSRLSNFTISILDSSSSVVASQNFYEGSGNASSTETWELPYSVTGRTVRIELIGGLNNDGNNVLSLAEVQVLSGGVASQFTTDSGGGASRAIDNNTDGEWANGSVTHTDSSSENWWEVKLTEFSVIEQVNLFNRTDVGVENRLSNFRVTLWQGATQVYSSDHFTQIGTYATPLYMIYDLNGTVADRVRIESLGANSAGDRVISLAELQVFGEVLATANTDSDSDKLKDSWELSYYGHLGVVSDTADSDGDGYNSFKEMAFGTDPTTKSQLSDHMTSSIIEDGGVDKLELSFRRPTNHAALGVVYQLKSSIDLATWADDTTPVTATTPDADGTTEWISFRFTPSAAAKKFIQLEATTAP